MALEHVASLFVRETSVSKWKLASEEEGKGGRGEGGGKVVLMMVKEGSFFLLYFKGLDSVSIHFPRLSVSRRNTAELTCVAFSTAPVWVSECAFCALLRFTGSTGPDACCLFPHIERCRRHVWRFLVLCFVLFEMLKMTFGVAPPIRPPPKLTHTPQRTPSFCAHPHWSVQGCLWVLVGVNKVETSKREEKTLCDFC